MAREHWNGYTGPLIDHGLKMLDVNDRVRTLLYQIAKHLCITHFVHGAKHERDSFDEELSKV